MKLQLTIEKMKDSSKELKQVMFATLFTDIPDMEKIVTVAEIPENSVLGEEFQQIIMEMLKTKKDSMIKKPLLKTKIKK